MDNAKQIHAMIKTWRTETQGELAQLTAMIEAHTKRYVDADKGTQPYKRRATMHKSLEILENTIFILDDLDSSLPDAGAAQFDEPQTWAELIEWLDVGDNREELGREVAIFRLAVDKATEKLSDYHEFCDGTVDRPILSSETIGEDD